MRVVGLDVCKDSVVACILDAAPLNEPRQLYYDLNFPRFFTDALGIKSLLDLAPTVAVLEPTGVNYSKLWVTKLAEAGVEVVLVGHKQLRGYRENLDLPDKDDSADALALACYYLEHQGKHRRFVRTRDPVIAKIRDIVLRLYHLSRVQSPIINRIRQDLVWQFPEARHITLDAILFWGWLAGERKSTRYDNLYAATAGLGLQREITSSARIICDLQRRERVLELEMRALMKDIRFHKYRKVFAQFGFGERVEALILSQIYPLENYLDENGQPEIKIRKGKESGNPTKRHLSRRRFQKALGVAPTREDSGDKKSTKKAGSSLCRMALWQWVFTRIEPKKSRLKTQFGKFLGDTLDLEKQHRPVKLARSRLASKAVNLLFRELVKELGDPRNN
ncbi:MAG: IS110 family transposase [Chroococcidiopsis sp.]